MASTLCISHKNMSILFFTVLDELKTKSSYQNPNIHYITYDRIFPVPINYFYPILHIFIILVKFLEIFVYASFEQSA